MSYTQYPVCILKSVLQIRRNGQMFDDMVVASSWKVGRRGMRVLSLNARKNLQLNHTTPCPCLPKPPPLPPPPQLFLRRYVGLFAKL